ncbi:hypothetical protein [Leptotrichia sp. oral taxon 223]|uniref:hypothetical protein n=1 Tax=Leptotrichia sp. oral taxon 223 TaxID=712363 RepID=UPI0015BB3684|nr:hypothetical protein [Leptotrichia sp. oral taxon 223]NWO20280.1 hypothetical protein [Leptotrichia sp. oral taxon 223]
MIIKFSYYEDEDFGLTAFPEIRFSEKEITKNKKSEHLEKKKEEYTKYLITGIMEDFPDLEIINIFLPQLEKVETGKVQETVWDGQAFQHKINKEKVEFEHTIFGICEEYPLWSCKFEEYKKVLEGWEKFLEMEVDLRSEVVMEV